MHELANHGFIHSSGKIIPIHRTERDFIAPDHSEYVVKNPHIFGMTEEDVKAASGSDYEGLKKGTRAESVSLKHHLSQNGYSTYYTTRDSEYTPEGNVYTSHHVHIGTIGSNNSAESFIPKIQALIPHLNKIGKDDKFTIHVSGAKDHPEMKFTSMSEINQFVNSSILPREKNITPNVTSSEIRQKLGKKPESMSTAEWNNIRIIGDSFEYSIPSFKQYLRDDVELINFEDQYKGAIYNHIDNVLKDRSIEDRFEYNHENMGDIHPDYTLHHVHYKLKPNQKFTPDLHKFLVVHKGSNRVASEIQGKGYRRDSGKNEIKIISNESAARHRKRVTGTSLPTLVLKKVSDAGHVLNSDSMQSAGAASVWRGLKDDPSLRGRIFVRKGNDELNYEGGDPIVPAHTLRNQEIWAAMSPVYSKGIEYTKGTSKDYPKISERTFVLYPPNK